MKDMYMEKLAGERLIEIERLKKELQELRMKYINAFGQEQTVSEDAVKAYEKHETQDVEIHQAFIDGFKAGVAAYSESVRDKVKS